jgi:hypothetical protein
VGVNEAGWGLGLGLAIPKARQCANHYLPRCYASSYSVESRHKKLVRRQRVQIGEILRGLFGQRPIVTRDKGDWLFRLHRLSLARSSMGYLAAARMREARMYRGGLLGGGL